MATPTATRPYVHLRDLVESLGGRMWHARLGYRWGAWVVELGVYRREFVSNGSGYPQLDQLYVPEVPNPKQCSDFTETLAEGAEDRFMGLIRHGEG